MPALSAPHSSRLVFEPYCDTSTAAAADAYAPVGPWQPVRLLGRGRWTYVFQARPIHAADDAPADYVIKALQPNCSQERVAISALAREAYIAREMSHPNLPVLLATHVHRAPHHIAFLHDRAVTARRLITSTNDVQAAEPLSIPLALWIVRQAAMALEALHQAGWLHGDVKPDNLLVTPAGQTTLIDLGLARRLNGEECHPNELLSGSCVYLSPEMIVGREALTAASDVYALGLTLFELLIGKPPMDTIDRSTVIGWHLRSVAPELREHLPHAPLRLARLLRAMLARQPLRRPALSEIVPWLAELEIDTFALRMHCSHVVD
jgi:eukaryotic-like serine/threonine-protein kinase